MKRTLTDYERRAYLRSREGSEYVCQVLRSRYITGSCTGRGAMECGGCFGMLLVFLRPRGPTSAVETLSLVQVQLPRVFQDGVMRALHTGEYDV